MPENEEKDGGKGFAKTDMERIGIFKELGYITIGDKYTTSDNAFNQSASKGRQIQVTGPKQKSGLQAGYFNEKFTRVMEGEAYSDQVKIRAQYRMNESKKNLGGRFVPTNGEKKMSGVGSYYGSFSGPIEALSPVVNQAKAHEPPKKNLYTNPGKKGTGYGYTGVTFSRYNDYASENYDQFREIVKQETEAHKKAMRGNAFRLSTAPREYFDENPYKSDKPVSPARSKSAPQSSTKVKPFKPTSPAKRDGGMKAGTFEAYPSHSSEPYKVRKTDKKEAQANQKVINKVFVPPAGIKSTPVNSVLNQNVNRSVNIQNYRTVQAVMSY